MPRKSITRGSNTNTNTNINNIKIEMPKPRQYRPRTKPIKQAEEELQKLENADAGYNMGQPINVSVVQPPTINPSVYGFSHIPIPRDISTTAREEPVVMPEPAPAAEEPVAPTEPRQKRKYTRRPPIQAEAIAQGSPARPYLPPAYERALQKGYESGFGYETAGLGGYESDIGYRLPHSSDFERKRFAEAQQNLQEGKALSYIQSAKDIQLGQGGLKPAKLGGKIPPPRPPASPKPSRESSPRESKIGIVGTEPIASEGEEIVIRTVKPRPKKTKEERETLRKAKQISKELPFR